jgi:hypothetical protein
MELPAPVIYVSMGDEFNASGHPEEIGRQSGRAFKYWIEVLERSSGTVVTLPMAVMTRIQLRVGRNQVIRPAETILRISEGSNVFEASTLEDLATQLRQRYPDETHERKLIAERDYEAERRHEEAIEELARIFARAAAKSLISSIE